MFSTAGSGVGVPNRIVVGAVGAGGGVGSGAAFRGAASVGGMNRTAECWAEAAAVSVNPRASAKMKRRQAFSQTRSDLRGCGAGRKAEKVGRRREGRFMVVEGKNRGEIGVSGPGLDSTGRGESHSVAESVTKSKPERFGTSSKSFVPVSAPGESSFDRTPGGGAGRTLSNRSRPKLVGGKSGETGSRMVEKGGQILLPCKKRRRLPDGVKRRRDELRASRDGTGSRKYSSRTGFPQIFCLKSYHAKPVRLL